MRNIVRNFLKLFFCFCVLFSLAKVASAELGIKIVEPHDGAELVSGEEIAITVEPVEGFGPDHVAIGGPFLGSTMVKDSPPFVVYGTIPEVFVGPYEIVAVGMSLALKKTVSDKITVTVKPNANLVSFDFGDYTHFHFTTDWNGNPAPDDESYVRVEGVYSDGITRDTPYEYLTFLSSDPSVASVDSEGVITPHSLGETTITVSSGDVNGTVTVIFEEPRGIRPDEIIPPTVQIDIQPPANTAGWHDSDITITITAQDNEGGSGIREIVYSFPYLSADTNFIESDQAIISFSEEGINLLRYGASDNEGNNTGQQRIEIKLDKTPPSITITSPAQEAAYLLNQTVIADWTVEDSLSSLEESSATTPCGQAIDTATAGSKSFIVSATDKAGNSSNQTANYYVRYQYSGVLPPVKSDGSAVFKLGRTVPIKFRLQDASGSYVSTATARMYLAKISDNVSGEEVEAVSTSAATEGNLFRYDSADHCYIFNLATQGLSRGTWQVRIALDDDTSQYTSFGLK